MSILATYYTRGSTSTVVYRDKRRYTELCSYVYLFRLSFPRRVDSLQPVQPLPLRVPPLNREILLPPRDLKDPEACDVRAAYSDFV